jgi:esterase/lipase superfamily enzyme
VTVEALRQIKIGERLPVGKVGAVVLASPDIDIDVFKSQMRRFGRPSKPFFVVLSRDDEALAFSEKIAGGKERLGDYHNDAELAAMGAIVIDMSNVKGTGSMNHDKFVQLTEIAPELHRVLERGVATQAISRSAGDPAAAGVGIAAIVELPLRIAGGTVDVVGPR